MEKEIIEGNKLIADFQGRKLSDFIVEKEKIISGAGSTAIWDFVECAPDNYSELKYHTSWDWLMPAWRKVINEIGIWMAVHEKPHYSKLWSEKCEQISRAISAVDIDSAFKEIKALIHWYNSQNIKP